MAIGGNCGHYTKSGFLNSHFTLWNGAISDQGMKTSFGLAYILYPKKVQNQLYVIPGINHDM